MFENRIKNKCFPSAVTSFLECRPVLYHRIHVSMILIRLRNIVPCVLCACSCLIHLIVGVEYNSMKSTASVLYQDSVNYYYKTDFFVISKS